MARPVPYFGHEHCGGVPILAPSSRATLFGEASHSVRAIERVILPVLLVAGMVLPAGASAAPLGGFESAPQGLPPLGTPGVPARSIRSVATSFDAGTGTWATTVSFYAPQSASTQAVLHLALGSTQRNITASAGLQAWTNPASPGTRYFFDAGTSRSLTPSSPSTTTTFADGNREMTVRVRDPALAGGPFDELSLIRLSRGTSRFDLLPAMVLSPPGAQGPPPRLVLPDSNLHLRVSHGQVPIALGRITLPVTIAAFVQLHGRVVATYEERLAAKPPSFRLSLLPAARSLLPHGATRGGRLVIELYSRTGVSTVLHRQITIRN